MLNILVPRIKFFIQLLGKKVFIIIQETCRLLKKFETLNKIIQFYFRTEYVRIFTCIFMYLSIYQSYLSFIHSFIYCCQLQCIVLFSLAFTTCTDSSYESYLPVYRPFVFALVQQSFLPVYYSFVLVYEPFLVICQQHLLFSQQFLQVSVLLSVFSCFSTQGPFIEFSQSLRQIDANLQTHLPSTQNVKMPNLPKIDVHNFKYNSQCRKCNEAFLSLAQLDK